MYIDNSAPTYKAVPASHFQIAIERALPHDTTAFTQGLAFYNGFLYESTGLYGHSSLRQLSIESGRVLKEIALPPTVFGEGVAIVEEEIVQLTWQSKMAFVYDLHTFCVKRRFSYRGEGWGLAHSGAELFMSDGTSHLRVLNAHTFAERQTIHVHDQGHSIMNLNDIEFVEGVIFANVWRTDDIAIICPSSGAILSWINLGGIVPQIRHSDSNAVLNGIAYDSNRKRLYVTGKRWPTLFEIRVDHLSGLYGASQPSGCTDVTKVAPAIVCTD